MVAPGTATPKIQTDKNRQCEEPNIAGKDRNIPAASPRIEIEYRTREGNGQPRICPPWKLEVVCCKKECLEQHVSFSRATPKGVRTLYYEAGDSNHPALCSLSDWAGLKLRKIGTVPEVEESARGMEKEAVPSTPVVPSVRFEFLKKKNRIAVLEESPQSGRDTWYDGTVVELSSARDSVLVCFEIGGNRWVRRDETWKPLSA